MRTESTRKPLPFRGLNVAQFDRDVCNSYDRLFPAPPMRPPMLIALVVFAGIHWLNRAAARRLTRAIDALDQRS